MALLDLYGVHGEEREGLLRRLQNPAATEWITPRRDQLPGPYGDYIEVESEVRLIRSLEAPAELDTFRTIHARLERIALDESGSRQRITQRIREIQEGDPAS